MRRVAAIGFRAKTGRAIAVAVAAGDPHSFVFREEIALWDAEEPATGQPYHEVMEMPWAAGVVAAKKYIDRIEAIARGEFKRLLAVLKSRGFEVHGVGVVGSKDRDLANLGNPHIRAHAAEGILFRHVLEVAAKAHRKSVMTFTDADVTASRAKLAGDLRLLSEAAGSPWRADEKAAASGALLVLIRSTRSIRKTRHPAH